MIMFLACHACYAAPPVTHGTLHRRCLWALLVRRRNALAGLLTCSGVACLLLVAGPGRGHGHGLNARLAGQVLTPTLCHEQCTKCGVRTCRGMRHSACVPCRVPCHAVAPSPMHARISRAQCHRKPDPSGVYRQDTRRSGRSNGMSGPPVHTGRSSTSSARLQVAPLVIYIHTYIHTYREGRDIHTYIQRDQSRTYIHNEADGLRAKEEEEEEEEALFQANREEEVCG